MKLISVCQTKLQNRKYLLFFWGLIWACVFIIPHFFLKEVGEPLSYKMEKVTEAYESLIANGTFDNSHLSHSLGWIYMPYLMKFFGWTATATFNAVESLYGMIVLIVYPYLIDKVYKNSIIALLSPFFVHFISGMYLYRVGSEEFYSISWATILAIPLLILLINAKDYKDVLFSMIGISFAAMGSNILRLQSGITIVFVSVIILVYKVIKNRKLIPSVLISVAILAVSYNLLAVTVPLMITRDWEDDYGALGYNSSPWHSILIGFGYEENEYGLRYADESGKDYITGRYPEIEYNSDEYYEKCKEEALYILRTNPGFVIRVEMKKFFVTLWETLKYEFKRYFVDLLWVACFIALILMKKVRVFLQRHGAKLLICAVLLILATYPCVAAIPGMYIYPAFGSMDFLVMFFLFSFMDTVLIDRSNNRTEEIADA